MSDLTADAAHVGVAHDLQKLDFHRPRLNTKAPLSTIIIFLALLAAGILFALYGLTADIGASGTPPLGIGVFVSLGIALLSALAFELSATRYYAFCSLV
jgi:hypothetical protein